MLTPSLITLRQDDLLMRAIIEQEFKITFTNYDSFVCGTDPVINNLEMLKEEVIRLLLTQNKVIGARTLKYWEATFEKVLAMLQLEREAQLVAHLKYDPSLEARSEIKQLVAALTGAQDPVDIAAIEQFIWQIKRKINSKEVTYHLMPILWGKQKSGKSETIRKLLRPIEAFVYQGSTFGMLNDDRYARAFTINYCFFFDEMRKVQHADIESVKAMVSTPNVSWRMLGKNKFITKANKATFIGASNLSPASLLRDTTGMRRFWYIKTLDKIDWDIVNSINWLNLWRSIDEGRDRAYTFDVFDLMDTAQEDLRPKDPLEDFLDEGLIVADADKIMLAKEAYMVYYNYLKEEGNQAILKRDNFESILRDKYGFKFFTKQISSTQKRRYIYGYINKKRNNMLEKKL